MPKIMKLDVTNLVIPVSQPYATATKAPAATNDETSGGGAADNESTGEPKAFAGSLGEARQSVATKPAGAAKTSEKTSETTEPKDKPTATKPAAAEKAAPVGATATENAKPTLVGLQSSGEAPRIAAVTIESARATSAWSKLAQSDVQARVANVLLQAQQARANASFEDAASVISQSPTAEPAVAKVVPGQTLPSPIDELTAAKPFTETMAEAVAAKATPTRATASTAPVQATAVVEKSGETAPVAAASAVASRESTATAAEPSVASPTAETWRQHREARQAWAAKPAEFAEAVRSYQRLAEVDNRPQPSSEASKPQSDEATPQLSSARVERTRADEPKPAATNESVAKNAPTNQPAAPVGDDPAPAVAAETTTISVDAKANPVAVAGPFEARRTDAATAAAPPAVDLAKEVARLERLAEATSRAVVSKAADGGGSMRLCLEPPELGQMRLDIQVTRDAVRAEAVVESSQVKQALLDQMPQLRQELANRGLDLQSFDVRQQTFDWNGQNSANGDRSFTWRDDGRRSVEESAQSTAASRPRSGGMRTYGGGISVFA